LQDIPGALPPKWVTLGQLAESWGKAPWDLEDNPRAMPWIARKLEMARIKRKLEIGDEE
jgi:hypothetical protein